MPTPIRLKNYLELVNQGRWLDAIQVLTVGVNEDPREPIRRFNRGTCFLGTRRLENALADFQVATELSSDNDLYPGFIGVTYWWLGKRTEAVQAWKEALTAEYTDAAGGVEIPALLFFAAHRLDSKALEKQSIALLRKRWKPRVARPWPAPIAGYLLERISTDDLLATNQFQHPVLECRRRCQAQFWVAVRELVHGRQTGFRQQLMTMHSSVPMQYQSAVISELEYWLAHAELEETKD
jgi:tetratricopeptide (TPR) repeat protein